ncbi:unnamed protein product [Candidula unifasciata]|uniref:Metalloendopeptidase n=1 Tax=Candidula unifasciata TaxID=100452 RepID=A0A8S3ZRY1_9EUPU|nr:unnamed protein product [Candidula unifasciata]
MEFAIFLVLSLLVLESAVFTVSAEQNIPRRQVDANYLDPCKAEAYSGDIALTHNQFRTTKKMILKQTANDSFFELPVNSDGIAKRDTLNNFKDFDDFNNASFYLDKDFKNQLLSLNQPCKGIDIMQCRLNKMKQRKDLLDTRIKLMRLKGKIRNHNRRAKEELVEKPSFRSGVYKNSEQFKRHNPSTQHSVHKRGAIGNTNKLWEYGVIPYVIDETFSSKHKALFKLAMELWEQNTCLVFKVKEPGDKDYIRFTEEGTCGCCSFVGRGGGGQGVSLGKGCEKLGIVAHELGHAIGFHHEHNRPDRDKHIQIIYENIEENEKYNFNIQEGINSLGEEYDYDSIMHYSRSIFARKPNLYTLNPHRKPGMILPPQIGQRVKPSEGDVRQVAKMYGCPQCGKTLLDPAGGFVHTAKPGSPEVCQWRISCTHGERVEVIISNLHLPESNSCETSYLDVRDGHYFKSPLLKRFCGNHSHEILTSSGNQMWIEFKKTNSDSATFYLDYECICGGEINKDEGYLTSPNYPDDYPSVKDCVWNITVPEHFVVGVTFEMFDLESHPRCSRDYVELRDGPTEQAPLLGNLCGSQMPKPVNSTGRHLYAKFVSSKYVQKSGFLLRFVKERDECATKEHGCEHNCVNTIGSYYCTCNFTFQLHSDGKRCEPACGGYVEDTYGNITSPSFPDIYPDNSKCIWIIKAPPDHTIYLNFTHFDLEGQGLGCTFDNLTITEESHETADVFCGYVLPDLYVSSGNTVTIEFNSDGTIQNSGFFVKFETDTDECTVDNAGCQHICKNTIGSYQCECDSGFILDSDMHSCKEERCHSDIESVDGFFYSPNYPDSYLGREDCSWLIVTAPGHRIHLEFIMLDIEYHQLCSYDHLAVYDGENSTARLIGKFCGTTLPEPITSSSNKIYVSFFSDASVQRSGFLIKHEVKCGGTLQASETEQFFVSHPRYGEEDYDVKQDCEWLIVAPKYRLIRLTFTEFELESEINCYYDVVFVYDGQYDTDPVEGKFCGIEIPDIITSSSNYLLVQFLSDYISNRKGFSASYRLL